ncbi:hypothetical protein PPACK8108_LOCUS22242 [Phakopsora pachyrhizi]|uniref:DUF1764-domain-containing protein n=1 Tax=Phakopsora pachyrhizi TaxID=170000 RepID=A0AAV0BJN4_PHAPC|nr:hypothetical protein PPACK8108_LOCUS17128 [Phakopsora pachyrhizi]CAH7687458.1 hypothetical protein PPACK8108_LOCUS22242 [Phakopsora pachyrhizi]
MTAFNSLSELDSIFSRKASSSTSDKDRPTSSKSKRSNPDQQKRSSILNVKTIRSITQDSKKGKGRDNQSVKKEFKPVEEEGDKQILDPSQRLITRSSKINQLQSKRKLNSEEDEEELKFRDSRGNRAKTDDGLYIYSIEELRIGLGGETPECPFDCNCCF